VPAYENSNSSLELCAAITLYNLIRSIIYKKYIKGVSNLLCALIPQRPECDEFIEIILSCQDLVIRAGRLCSHIDKIYLITLVYITEFDGL
jgi:hypothetical protein